ncbi:MAG: hypothetical protein GY750_00285 [Lentisphaerae bacterium]|nr:hypothetical protein [Lentisphaerota bacterium]MCP4099857.1 hypothetical protein [Lentisphaerota bacterium]
MLKYIAVIFCAFIICIQSIIAADVLFLSYDYGDANSFKEVKTVLDQNHISSEIIGIGKAYDVFNTSDNLMHKYSAELTDFNNETFIKSRSELLSKKDVVFLVANVNPKVIVTGMSSAALAQLADCIYDAYKIAYYDNFDLLKNSTYVDPFLEKLRSVNSLFITADKIKESFQQVSKKYHANVVVAGAPSLNIWSKTYKEAKPEQIREKLGISPKEEVVVFAGDTTDDYEVYFKEFADAMNSLPDVKAVVTYHPKTDGSIEKSVIESLNAKNIIIADSTYNTIELSTISDVFIVHKSSMGAQSLSVGKNVIFVASNDYDNLFVKNDLAQLAPNNQEVKICIVKALHTSGHSSLADYGVPENANEIFLSKIQRILKNCCVR